MVLEELYLIIACMLVAAVMTFAFLRFHYLANTHTKHKVFQILMIISVMSLYLSIVGSFIMLYMAIARYFQIIF